MIVKKMTLEHHVLSFPVSLLSRSDAVIFAIRFFPNQQLLAETNVQTKSFWQNCSAREMKTCQQVHPPGPQTLSTAFLS